MNFLKKALPFTALILILATLIFSLFKFTVSKKQYRYVVYFDSPDSNYLCTETRFLSKIAEKSKEQVFVEDILLGPLTNRYKLLFNRNTVCEFCFVRDKTLFLGLSEKALEQTDNTVEIKRGIEILRKNILKNFKNINTIEMYIGGKEIL